MKTYEHEYYVFIFLNSLNEKLKDGQKRFLSKKRSLIILKNQGQETNNDEVKLNNLYKCVYDKLESHLADLAVKFKEKLKTTINDIKELTLDQLDSEGISLLVKIAELICKYQLDDYTSNYKDIYNNLSEEQQKLFNFVKAHYPHYLAANGDLANLKKVINASHYDINKLDPHPRFVSPMLNKAVFSKHKDVVLYLLKKGADPDQLSGKGLSARDMARKTVIPGLDDNDNCLAIAKALKMGDQPESPRQAQTTEEQLKPNIVDGLLITIQALTTNQQKELFHKLKSLPTYRQTASKSQKLFKSS